MHVKSLEELIDIWIIYIIIGLLKTCSVLFWISF